MLESVFDMEACLTRVRRGDEQAARECMEHLYPLVLKLVRAHLPKRTAEEDMCQMIFIRMFSNLQYFSGKVPVEHWVSRISINTCLNVLKSESIRPEVHWADLSPEEAGVLETLHATQSDLDLSEAIASRELLDTLLAGLNAQDRLIVNLLHIEGHTLAEACQITGWNLALVKVRAFRARQRLKKALHRIMKEGNT
jgi:RNA polymerase sigma-70 factor (ECF subfamily)